MKHKKTIIISAIVAACLLLLPLAAPAFNKVVEIVSSFTAGWDSGMTGESLNELINENIITEYYSDIPEGVKIVPSDSPIELSDAEKREIVWSYIKNSEDKDKLDYTYSVECYGKFDGMYAVMIGSSGAFYSDAIRYETVGDVEFVFPSGQKMYIYRWGNFYSLAEASAFVDEEDLMSILCSKRQFSLIPKHRLPSRFRRKRLKTFYVHTLTFTTNPEIKILIIPSGVTVSSTKTVSIFMLCLSIKPEKHTTVK